MKQVLLVDDHDEARAWMREACEQAFAPERIDESADLRGAREALARRRYDLVLLDLGLPDGSGLDLLPVLRAIEPPPQVVVATVYDDPEYLFPALRLGAQGYVLKDERIEDLVDALRAMGEGRPPLSPSIARAILAHFALPAPAAPAVPAEPLTEREREVVAAIAEGLTVRQAASRLGISPNTVSTHIKRAYAKLDVGSRAQASLAAARLGIVQR